MIVIATPSGSKRCTVIEKHREQFLQMLPQIRQQASMACRRLGAEARQEFMQGVLADAYAAFFRLVELGKENVAYATPLAQYAIRRVRCGRCVGSQLATLDVCSRYAQITRRFQVDGLDRRDANGMWKEVLVEDHRAGPAETAAARIDIDDWFWSLPKRNRRIAQALASGDATSDVAEEYGLSWSRISQLRQELRRSWLDFQGELPEVLARRTRSMPARRVMPALCAGRSTVCA